VALPGRLIARHEWRGVFYQSAEPVEMAAFSSPPRRFPPIVLTRFAPKSHRLHLPTAARATAIYKLWLTRTARRAAQLRSRGHRPLSRPTQSRSRADPSTRWCVSASDTPRGLSKNEACSNRSRRSRRGAGNFHVTGGLLSKEEIEAIWAGPVSRTARSRATNGAGSGVDEGRPAPGGGIRRMKLQTLLSGEPRDVGDSGAGFESPYQP